MVKYLLIAFLILPLAGCFDEKPDVSGDINTLYIEDAQGNHHKFDVELAVTGAQQMQGLMYRTEMDEDAGMLFYFGKEAERSFWMKNTLISLDIIFIKADGTIHHIHENSIPHDLTGIKSNGPVAAVLEINAGISKKLGLAPGNIVKHQFFSVNLAQ